MTERRFQIESKVNKYRIYRYVFADGAFPFILIISLDRKNIRSLPKNINKKLSSVTHYAERI